VGRIEALARNLSALRSVDARVQPPALSPVVLGGLVQFAIDSMQPLAAERGVRITLDGPGGESDVALANHDAVDRILVNLISNAVKFSSEGGTVRVAVRRDTGLLHVDVQDEGPGIPDTEKPHLFTRYFRARNALERRVPGSGLGLFISRELALRMNGDLSVADRTSGGSVFTLTLRPVDALNS
jgi:signal transduction histidine kinase